MKVNKKRLGLRIVTFPLKLIFQVAWFLVLAITTSFQWVLYGGQEIYYGKDDYGGSLCKLIESNKELVDIMNSKVNNDE